MSQKTERLVNVTIALLETRRPLSFAELRQKSGYYTDQDHEAARRMFERDKDDLRHLGVPINTQPIPHSDDLGYIINRKQYELADPVFTREEMTALALAQQYSTSADASLAFAKIAARAPDPDVAHRPSATDLRITDSLYPPDVLAQAIIERVTVSFTYETRDRDPSQRTVNPFALARRKGRWYVVGHDHDRQALRAFRLDRIVGSMVTVSDRHAFTAPEQIDVVHELLPPTDELLTVTGDVRQSFATQVTARGGVLATTNDTESVAGWVGFTLTGVDLGRDLPWLLEFGDQLRLSSPPQAVAAITEALTVLYDTHRTAT